MKTKLFLLVVLLCTLSLAQSKFQSGYYINSSGNKVTCLIKNYDWKNNPKQFEIKNSLEDTPKTISIYEIKEIAIDNDVKFIKANVDLDYSSDNVQTMDSKKDPVFSRQLVLLKVLVEGKNNLYSYEDENIQNKMFFNNTDVLEITPLIHKLFLREYNTVIESNDTYKQQLNNNVICENNITIIEKLNYTKSDLIKYFITVNKCLGDTTTKEISSNKKFIVNFKPMIIAMSARMDLDMKSGNLNGTHSLENKLLIGAGIEIESMMPFNNYNWSIYIQPMFLSGYTSSVQGTTSTFYKYSIDGTYNFLQMPIGVRRYIPLNDNSKIFLNLAYNYVYTMNSSKLNITGDPEKSLKTNDLLKGGLSLGAGFHYKKVEFEMTHCFGINNNISQSNAKLSYTSFALKYHLF